MRVLTRAALIGAPIAVLLVGLSTYFVTSLTLRSVAALRHGAADITAAGLAGQRLPVPSAQDEIHRLAITLNQMLDRIESRDLAPAHVRRRRRARAALAARLAAGAARGGRSGWARTPTGPS